VKDAAGVADIELEVTLASQHSDGVPFLNRAPKEQLERIEIVQRFASIEALHVKSVIVKRIHSESERDVLVRSHERNVGTSLALA